MNPREFIAVVEGISYRPGWKLSADWHPGYQSVQVVLNALVDDAYGGLGARRVDVLTMQMLSYRELEYFDVPRVLDWVRHCLIMEMEDHESREFFKYKGERVFDPHKGHGV